MWKKLALCAVPVQAVVLALWFTGTGSAQPEVPGPGTITLPGLGSTPQSITLSGIIRDFRASHPDFEHALGVDHGITTVRLGPDRKPVYASATTTPTTTGKANFDQWYRDVPGVNQRTDYSITMDRVPNSDPPVYRYANNSFFPIDGKMWGNEGQIHNYWFTYELHHSFTYQGGERFNFTGDDDVWVYINNRKVIDLGGVHTAMSAAANLDDLAAQLGLVRGRTYDFDMFFAERHTTQSDFIAETSLQLQPPQQPPPPPQAPTPGPKPPPPPPKKP